MSQVPMHTGISQISKENVSWLQKPIHMNTNKGKHLLNKEVKYIDIDFTTHVLFLETDDLLQIKEVYNEGSISEPDLTVLESAQTSSPDVISSDSAHASLSDQHRPINIPDYLQGENLMSNVKEAMNAIMTIDGAIGVAIVDWNSGLTLGTQGSGLNLDLAAAGNTNVVRAKQKVMRDLGLKDSIEDILITLSTQYHMIRPLQSNPNLFIYVVMNRAQANLGMARYQLQSIEHNLTI